jgi:hypothetical protein
MSCSVALPLFLNTPQLPFPLRLARWD